MLTHQYLLRAIWGPGYINQSQYLRVFIAQIRKKIEDDPNTPQFLLTESGLGYRFVGIASLKKIVNIMSVEQSLFHCDSFHMHFPIIGAEDIYRQPFFTE